MFKHIAVAVDFSLAWDVMFRHLPKLRGWGCERLTLVHVLASRYPQAPAETHRDQYEARLAASADALKVVGLPADGRVVSGDPAAALIDVAREIGADCLLAGSHGHSTLHDFFLGSTVLNVARLTTLPLLLIPVHAALPPPERISRAVLGFDCSGASQGAERFFRELIDAGVEGLAVCAMERGLAEDRADEQHCAQEHVDRLNRGRARPVQTRIEVGLAAEVILRAARDIHADLIVVGKRGHNHMRELLLGSTAETVCRRAQIPVMLVPGN